MVTAVKDLLVLVHPDLRQSNLVTSDHLRALGKGVGALGAENMTDNGAGDDLQLSAALPHLQVNGRQRKQMYNDMRLDTPIQPLGQCDESTGDDNKSAERQLGDVLP